MLLNPNPSAIDSLQIFLILNLSAANIMNIAQYNINGIVGQINAYIRRIFQIVTHGPNLACVCIIAYFFIIR